MMNNIKVLSEEEFNKLYGEIKPVDKKRKELRFYIVPLLFLLGSLACLSFDNIEGGLILIGASLGSAIFVLQEELSAYMIVKRLYKREGKNEI